MRTVEDYIQLPDGSWSPKGQLSTGISRGTPIPLKEVTPIQKPQKGSELLNEIVSFILRFVVLSQSQAESIALWVIHTYTFESADTTPYLNIHSPEKRSGKTRLLEVLELITARPWFTGRVTAAVLARKVDAECPTLLLDESDAAFRGDKEYAETLRSLLNTGYRRGGKCSVCVGQGTKISYKDLSTFCPKAIAGIGNLPDTVADRSIPIVLKHVLQEKLLRSSDAERLREAAQIRYKIAHWVSGISIGDTEPEIPNELDDRAADCIEPLLAIADAAGGDWPDKARKSAIALMTNEIREDDSLGIHLLSDIRTIFENGNAEIASVDLASVLSTIEESPWGDLNGRPLSPRRLASFLKPYGICPKTVRMGDITLKGYMKSEFKDAWDRYLPPEVSGSVTSVTLGTTQAQKDTPFYPSHDTSKMANVTDPPQTQLRHNVTDVTDRPSSEEEKDQKSSVPNGSRNEWEMDL